MAELDRNQDGVSKVLGNVFILIIIITYPQEPAKHTRIIKHSIGLVNVLI